MTKKNLVDKITNYNEGLEFLYRLRLFGTKLGLHNIRRLLELLGNPHHGLVFYHIAGTNGKGSVAAILQALLRTTHQRVGLFTSPHLEDFRERIRINNRLISRREVLAGLREIRPLLSRVAESSGCSHPTYFEVVTALACRYFQKMKADAVVWEVGLGGRLDATNVVEPRVSIITNIALEHQQYLGKSLGRIAREKGGIVKEKVPLVTAVTRPEALSCLKKLCRERAAPFVEVSRNYRSDVKEWTMKGQLLTVHGPRRVYRDLYLPLLGEHQVRNCETALAAWEQGESRNLRVAISRIRVALSRISWPGRFEFIPGAPDFILDGAHNQAGALVCAKTLRMVAGDRPVILILGVLADKDVKAICRPLVPLARKVIAVQPEGERGLASSALARTCRSLTGPKKIPVLARKSLESAFKYCYRVCPSAPPGMEPRTSLICVTGSLRLIGQARRILKQFIKSG
ncbi:MAG: folylpolyglutamate synthase/dihydrofolate synthase family protein [Candidatus Euphemobacter frigidus]|nr:folylpolyglutamate synthase/dihydrofolate synthase family protein [Candidatus Euphemobacter frigidus]MDP8275603.1 folylpolyglutamate synthase/dihydrofolate synthase family protein [Candidatus Euphemobacter frigidus]